MKKWIISSALILIGFANLNAQAGSRIGAHLGFTTGDASDYFGVNIGGSASHLFPIIDNLYLGGMIGMDIIMGRDIPGKTTKSKGLTMIPIAVRGQYVLGEQFFVGLDFGYGMSMSKIYKGGFLVEPKVGWQSDDFELYGFYKTYDTGFKRSYIGSFGSLKSLAVLGIGGAYFF